MTLFAMVTTTDSKDYTGPALDSFFKHTALSADDEFFLIDNDGAFSNEPLPSGVKLLSNSTPLGFAANVNQMIDRALKKNCDLLFLNNDVIFTRNWLPPLLVEKTVITTPLSNREVQYGVSVVIPKTDHIANTFLTRLPPMQLSEYSSSEAQLEAIVEAHQKFTEGYLTIMVLPFFCVRLPYPVMQTLGYFDEQFGTGGGEDYDYCLRAYLAGFSVKFALASYLLHFGGRSTYSVKSKTEDQQEREQGFRRYFETKWGSELYRLIIEEDSTALESPNDRTVGFAREQIVGNLQELLGNRSIQVKLQTP